LRIERLESRALPSTASLWQGTLSVTGTAANDTITVKEQNGRLVVVGTPIQIGGTFAGSVGLAAVSRVFIAGGPGNDVINVGTISKKATILAGVGNDRITGGLGADDIYGRDGNDTLNGGGGNDSLFGENGDDTLSGDDGDDALFGGFGKDSISGGAGDDTLFCEADNDIATGGDGNDVLRGNVGNDQLNGGAGNDLIVGEDGDDIVSGDAGSDTVSGGFGQDTVIGGDGNDEMTGEEGNDSLDGGAGNDTMNGGLGNDKAFGGAGDDLILGEDGIDTLHGDDGNDTVGGGTGTDFVFGDAENDFVTGGEVPDFIDGGTGNDTVGGSDGDVTDGGGGSDTVVSGGGSDSGGDIGTPGGGAGGGSNATATVLQVIRSLWPDGSTNDITVRNTGATTVNGWKVEFDADFDVTDVWNARLVDHTGNHYTFANIPNHWATTIKPNSQITFGFNAHLYFDDTTAIHSIEFNDQPLASNAGTGNGGTVPATGTVTQTVRSEWFDGSTNDIAIRNTGTTPINGWTVSFDADFDITDIWNAQIVGRVGNRYTIRNIPNSWNARIMPNTEVSFGFNTRMDLTDDTGIRNVVLTANNP